jgi:hypothetical protein
MKGELKMRVRILVAVTAALVCCGAYLTFHHGGATASTTPGPRAWVAQVAPPLVAARLTQDAALTIARQSEWGRLMAQGYLVSTSYGAWVSPSVRTPVNGTIGQSAVQRGSASDVWAITTGGLNVPNHPPIGAQVQLRHYMTVFVDDRTGALLLTEIY